jgi:hypothetical protein
VMRNSAPPWSSPRMRSIRPGRISSSRPSHRRSRDRCTDHRAGRLPGSPLPKRSVVKPAKLFTIYAPLIIKRA